MRLCAFRGQLPGQKRRFPLFTKNTVVKKAAHLNCSFRLRMTFIFCAALISPAAWSADATRANPVAARLNNIGVAFMNQQLPGKALTQFEDAHRAATNSAIPLINEGIALIYLRRLPEAADMLRSASLLEPKNPRVWYSLGLALLDSGNQESALKAFQHAADLDPQDADSHYYVGSIDLALKDYDHAIAELDKALQISPLHASAQYGLARALQRSAKSAEAREHVQRFQKITQEKVGTIFSDNYGEQGHYATAEDMQEPPVTAAEMIPVTFVSTESCPAQHASMDGAGACILGLEGNGQKGFVSMHSGANAIQTYRIGSDGIPVMTDAKAMGLTIAGRGCRPCGRRL